MSKTIISLDSWRIKAYLTCEESYKFSYVENLRKAHIYKPAIDYTGQGTFVHSMLAIFYTMRALSPRTDRYTHSAATINIIKKNKLIKNAGLSPEFDKIVMERFQQYLFRYNTGDFIPTYRNGVIGVEVPFSIILYEDAEKIFILEGRIDLLSVNAAGPVFIDHKTQGKVSNLYERKIQFLCYALATGYEQGAINYFGLQQKYVEGVSLRQKFFHIPKSYVAMFKEYLISEVYSKIYAAHTTGYFSRNLNSCSGPDEKRPCEFSQICEMHGRPEIQDLMKKQNYDVVRSWSPWNDIDDAEREEVEV